VRLEATDTMWCFRYGCETQNSYYPHDAMREGIKIRTAFFWGLGLIVVGAVSFFVFLPHDRLDPPSAFPQLSEPYFGEPEPGEVPRLFAASILGRDLHSPPIFSPDGESVYWCRMDSEGTDEILWMRREDGIWQPPELVPFASRIGGSDAPFLSSDGKRLYFVSFRPANLGMLFANRETFWVAERTASGWGAAHPVPFAGPSPSAHWAFAVTDREALYFGSESEIYVAESESDGYSTPRPIGPPISTPGREEMPYVAADGSYMLFASDSHAGHLGNIDLYLSIRQPDGAWGKPIHLPPPVNSVHQDIYPSMSPDGRYLFFLSTRGGGHNAYWVDASVVTDLFPKAE